MEGGSEHAAQIRAYLLGRLTGAEREAVSLRMMEDAAFFALAQEQEDDLIDEAARGELDAEDSAALTGMLATASREDRLEFARALQRYCRRRGAAHSRWRYTGIAAGLVLACAAGWRVSESYRGRHRASVAGATRPRPAGAVFALYLAGGTTRGAGPARSVRLAEGTAAVELQLEFAGQANWATLRTTAGAVTASQRVTQARGGPIVMTVPAGLLAKGGYEVELDSEAQGERRPVEYYYFRID